MAKIPSIQIGSNQLANPKLSTQSPSATQTQAVGNGKGLEALGGAVEKSANYLYQQMDQARQYADKAKADVYRTQYMADIRLKESQRLNPDGSPITNTDTSWLREQLKKGEEGYKANFSSKDGEMEGMAAWGRDALVIENDTIKERMKNVGLVAKAADAVKVKGLEDSFDGSPEKEQEIRDAYSNRLIYDPVEAEKSTEIALKNARWNMFNRDRAMNPALMEENLKNNKYKFDPTEVEKARTIFDRDLNKMQGDNADKIILNSLEGKPDDIEMIKNLAATKKLDPKWAETRIKNILNVESIDTDPATYESIMDKINNNKTKASEIRLAIEQAQKNKLLSGSDAKSLYYVKQQGRDTTVYQDYYNETHKQSGFWNTAFETLKVAAGNLLGGGSSMVMELTRSLVTKAQQKQASPEQMPELAQQVVKEELIKQNPSIQSFPKGRIGVDMTTGIKYRFFPDGHKERVE